MKTLNKKIIVLALATMPGLLFAYQDSENATKTMSADGTTGYAVDTQHDLEDSQTIALTTDISITSSTPVSYDDGTDILTGPAFTFSTTDNTKSGFAVTFHDTHGGYLNSTSIENGISMADTDDSAKIALKWSCSGNAANLNGETVMNVATALDPTLPTAVTSPASVLGITDPAVPTIAQEVTCTSTLSNTSQLFGSLAAKPDGNTETYTFEANLIIGSSE